MSTTQHRAAAKPSTARTKYKAGKRFRRRANSNRGFWIVALVVVAVGIALVVAVALGGSTSSGADAAAPASLVDKVTTVPVSALDQVGAGSAVASPKAITAPPLTENGKPHVLYVGAEYCPYCATERWPMVLALSRFGTFSELKTTHSSSTDVYANTQTFSFHGATYSSPYLSFTGVEMETNKQQGDGYAPLDQLDAQQQQIFDTYDRPPYVSSQSSNGIPFIDFGGKYMIDGVTYDPAVLQGKSAGAIASALHDPTTKIAQGADGVANTFTAAICSLTHDQPAKVCSDPVIQSIKRSLS